jgi:MSHA biogenesis protein MshO
LPNSVRVTGNCATACFLEFIPVVAGGRYRGAQTSASTGNILDFTAADTLFDIVGPAITIPTGNKWLVVYNLGIPGADAYTGGALTPDTSNDVRRLYSGAVGSVTSIAFAATARLPFESPAKRFNIVTDPVTFECAPAPLPAGGMLRRYTGYGFNAAQVAPGAVPVLLASSVTGCDFVYQAQTGRRAGLVVLTLQLMTEGGETINLYYQVHVGNVP